MKNYCKKIYAWFIPSLVKPTQLTALGSGMWIGLYNDRLSGGVIRSYVLVDVSGTMVLDDAEKKFNKILIEKWYDQKPVWVV